MATDSALPKKDRENEPHEAYISWRMDFIILFVLGVVFAGVLTSVLIL